MSEIIVVATLKARPEKVDDAKQALSALSASTHAEDGNVMYALHQGIEDPTRFTFVERWASAEALQEHFTKPYLTEILGRVEELLTEAPDIVQFAPVLSGDASKNALAA